MTPISNTRCGLFQQDILGYGEAVLYEISPDRTLMDFQCFYAKKKTDCCCILLDTIFNLAVFEGCDNEYTHKMKVI